jgi:hypothetical protein
MFLLVKPLLPGPMFSVSQEPDCIAAHLSITLYDLLLKHPTYGLKQFVVRHQQDVSSLDKTGSLLVGDYKYTRSIARLA